MANSLGWPLNIYLMKKQIELELCWYRNDVVLSGDFHRYVVHGAFDLYNLRKHPILARPRNKRESNTLLPHYRVMIFLPAHPFPVYLGLKL